jgi:pyrroline-5-carboxylate reductase
MATKVGVIGAGGMLQYHAAGFKQAGAEIIAVADPAPGAAQKAATKWGIPHAYESVDAMLAAHKDLDAVSVIVPNKFHAFARHPVPQRRQARVLREAAGAQRPGSPRDHRRFQEVG